MKAGGSTTQPASVGVAGQTLPGSILQSWYEQAQPHPTAKRLPSKRKYLHLKHLLGMIPGVGQLLNQNHEPPGSALAGPGIRAYTQLYADKKPPKSKCCVLYVL